MRVLKTLALVLLIIGGINWGLIAVFEFDMVARLFGLEFGEVNIFTDIVYGLVGLSALYELFTFRQIHQHERERHHRHGTIHP